MDSKGLFLYRPLLPAQFIAPRVLEDNRDHLVEPADPLRFFPLRCSGSAGRRDGGIGIVLVVVSETFWDHLYGSSFQTHAVLWVYNNIHNMGVIVRPEGTNREDRLVSVVLPPPRALRMILGPRDERRNEKLEEKMI